MHYLGMSGMRVEGHLEYNTTTVVLSVVIAIVAATAALWAAVSVKGLLASLGAALVMGIAVSGMHYTGMAAVRCICRAPREPPRTANRPARSSFRCFSAR